MPRRPRLTLAGVPLHIIQRGNNRQACFFTNDDYQSYLEWLETYAGESGCAIHAFVLMTNHVHLLLTPTHANSSGQLRKSLGQRYVRTSTAPTAAVAPCGRGAIVPVLRRTSPTCWAATVTSS